jgi:hypothetical protein
MNLYYMCNHIINKYTPVHVILTFGYCGAGSGNHWSLPTPDVEGRGSMTLNVTDGIGSFLAREGPPSERGAGDSPLDP